jgi:hypothetical protein
VQLAGPGQGATEHLPDLPEGTARAAVQAIAKPGHQPLPGSVQALHGGGEGIGEHRRERPRVVDPLLGDPDPLATAGWRLAPGREAVRARVPGRQQADPRPAAPVRRLVAAWLQQWGQGGAVLLGLGQGLLQPPAQVVDQLGDAGLFGQDRPNPLANLGRVAGVGEVAVAA